MMPANVADATYASLDRLEARRGPVDAYVADNLGYSENELAKHFSRPQVDAVAIALDNIERGGALVLGDMGGIGKGRVGAAVLRYAMLHDAIPVFVTEKPDLYGDMIRDLEDIGVPAKLKRDLRIFITNTDNPIPIDEDAIAWKKAAAEAKIEGKPIPKREGRFLNPSSKQRYLADMNEVAKKSGKFDAVFTTYDQMNTIKGESTERRRFLKRIAPDAIIVSDESHNAGGAGPAEDRWKKKDAPANRAEFMRELVGLAKGVLYSSATYAKRPEVMDLYSRTDMGKAVDDLKDLPVLINKGGVPLQQVVASMLSQAGQYMRRERSMEGINYAVDPVKIDDKSYRDFSSSVREIFLFDRMIAEFRSEWMQDYLDTIGGTTVKDAGVGDAAAHTTNFASIMHNVVNQMLLGIKATQVAEHAIAAWGRGEKPVIALANTMETFVDDYADAAGIKVGQTIDISFGDVLRRYLSRTLRITIKNAAGEVSHVQIPVEELDPDLFRAYRKALDAVNEGDYAGIPVSPIDWMRARMAAAGMKVAEITGRKKLIDYVGSPPTLVNRPTAEMGPAGKRSTIAAFNKGDLDGIVLNRSGSTGVSLHAYYKYKDQKQRRMILAQSEPNIDVQMQMLWRIDRTGQVVLPAYTQVAAEIPAEVRPAAILMKKMASLNANTTGARKGVFTTESVDFLNKYGDQVVATILADDYETNHNLGSPLEIGDDGRPKIDDIARKATGRLVLLSPEDQQRFLDRIQSAYKEYIDQLDALGENTLEAKTVDLQARTIETNVVKERVGDSPFLDAVTIEKVSVKSPGRAMAPGEIVDALAKNLQAEKSDDAVAALVDLHQKGEEWRDRRVEDARKIAQRWVSDDLAATPEASREAKKKAHNDNFKRWLATMEVAFPGAHVSLDMPDGKIDGIVLEVKRGQSGKNPLALSAWSVTVAVPEGKRQLTFAMSRLYPPGYSKGAEDLGAAIERIASPSRYYTGPTQALLEKFTEARKEGRETRYIVTGNILAGYDAVNGAGQIINYTTEDGALRPGILMGRGFTIGKFNANRAVRLKTPEQAIAFLDKTNDALKSKDGLIELVPSGYQQWTINIAASRARGGRYYTDPSVREALGGTDLHRNQGVMTARLGREPFVATVTALYKLGAMFEATSNQQAAQDIVNQTLSFGRMASLGAGRLASVRPTAPRRFGIPIAARDPISSYREDKTIKAHPDYTAAKAGDIEAAVRAVGDLVPESDLERARQRFGSDVLYIPVISEEQSGHNRLPRALAELYAEATGANTELGIGQTNRAFHTGAGPMERIANRAVFGGDVQRGKRYVLVDDVTVMGSTLADLADHIQNGGGEVVGVVTLVNAGRGATLAPSKTVIRDIERRFGNAIREIFGIEPSSLTADEAFYLRNFRNADELRVRVAAARRQRSERLRSKGIQKDEGEGGLASLTRAEAGTRARETGPSSFTEALQRAALTPAADKVKDKLRGDVIEIVRRVAGYSIALKLSDKVALGQDEARGWGSYGAEAKTASGVFDPSRRLIELALADPRYRGLERSTAYHESYHAVEYLLQTDAERKLMQSEREMAQLRSKVEKAFGLTPDQTAGMYGYEVRAVAFEVYAAARDAGASNPGAGLHIGIRRFFDRLFNLLRRIRNYLNGLGFQTADDIFAKAYEGEFARREPSPVASPQEFVDGIANVRRTESIADQVFEPEAGRSSRPRGQASSGRGEPTALEGAPGELNIVPRDDVGKGGSSIASVRGAERHPKEMLTVDGQPVWAMVVDNLDNAVIHTVRYQKALDSDWRHNFYLPPDVASRVSNGDARVVWADQRGLRSMEPMPDAMRSELGKHLYRGQVMASVRPSGKVPIVAVQDRFGSRPFNVARKAAQRWALDNARGDYVNEQTGWHISVGGPAIRKSTSGVRTAADLNVLAELPSLLKSAALVETRPGQRPEIRAAHIFAAAAEVDGDLRAVKLVVMEDSRGRRFYDQHSSSIKPLAGSEMASALRSRAAPMGPAKGHIDIDTLVRNFKDEPDRGPIMANIRPAPPREETAEEHILSRIVPSDKNRTRLPTFNQVYTLTKDDLHPLRVLRDELLGPRERGVLRKQLLSWKGVQERLPIEQDPYRLARLTRGSVGKAEQMIERGTFGFSDLSDNGKGLKPILKAVGDNLDAFRAYMTARRALELHGRGIRTGIDPDKAEQVVDAGERFEKPFRELVDYNRRVLGYLRDSGVVSEKSYDAMLEANRDYVPFFRMMETDFATKGGEGRDLKVRDPIKGIRGSEREIIDPIESIIKNTYLYVALAEKNRVLTALDDLAQASPRGSELVQKPRRKTHPITVQEEEVAKFLEDHGLDPDDAESFTIFRPNAFRPARDEIAFYRDGKRQVRRVSPDVAEAVNKMDRESFNLLVKIIAAPARLLRAGATLSPEFIVRNPIRDQFSAFAFARGFVPVYDALLGLGSIMKRGQAYQTWLKAGGANSTLVSIDRNYIDQNVQRLSNPGILKRAKNVVTTPLEYLRMASEVFENATRVGATRRLLKKGASPFEAAYASREATLDFARQGAKMRVANAVIAFFNASLEGTDREMRGLATRPLATLVKLTAAITIPSILLWWANKDDDRVKELPWWVKDLFWIIPTDKWEPYQIKTKDGWQPATDKNMAQYKGKPPSNFRKNNGVWEINNGTIWKIPKPFTPGLLFGSVPERVLDAFYGENPRAFDQLGKAFASALVPSLLPNVIVLPIEQYANRSLFLDRPIVPKYLEDVLPQTQASPYTSETAKLIGAGLAKIGLDQSSFSSPLVIENYIRGWGGGLGMHAVALADSALRKTGAVPSKVTPSLTEADIPLIKAFAVRFPSAGAQSIQDFYTTYEERKKAAATVRYLQKAGRTEEAAEVRGSYALERAEQIHKSIGKQMKFVRDIWANETIPEEDKRRLIDSVYLQAIDMAKQGNTVFARTAAKKKSSGEPWWRAGTRQILENMPPR